MEVDFPGMALVVAMLEEAETETETEAETEATAQTPKRKAA